MGVPLAKATPGARCATAGGGLPWMQGGSRRSLWGRRISRRWRLPRRS